METYTPGAGRGYMGESVVGAVEEGDDLGAVANGAYAEGSSIDAVGDAVLHRPEDWIDVEAALVHIGEGVLAGGGFWTAVGTPQEGDYLCSIAIGEGAEVRAVDTVGNPLLDRPKNGFVVKIAFLYINKRICGADWIWTTKGAPQEGDHLGSLALAIGVEGSCGSAIGNLVLHRPKDRINEEGAFGNVSEGILTSDIAILAGCTLPVMSQSRNNFLGDQDFAANRTHLTLGQTALGAGGILAVDGCLSVA